MDHNQISRICREVLLRHPYGQTFGGREEQIPQEPWDRLIYHFAEQYKGADLTAEQLAEKFMKEVADLAIAILTV